MIKKLGVLAGVREGHLEWMRNHIIRREERTHVSGASSKWTQVIKRVSGPLLSLIYINDWPDGPESCLIRIEDDARSMTEAQGI